MEPDDTTRTTVSNFLCHLKLRNRIRKDGWETFVVPRTSIMESLSLAYVTYRKYPSDFISAMKDYKYELKEFIVDTNIDSFIITIKHFV